MITKMKGEFDDHKAQILKEKKYPHQGKITRKAQKKEIKKGQIQNSLGRHGHGEKTPEEEIEGVLRWLKNEEMVAKYIDWLSERMAENEFDFGKEEFGDFEMMTASVGAGGAGRQTARNARARTHLITGIRAKSEQDRKAHPNEEMVMKKLEKRVRKHVENWKVVFGDGFRIGSGMTRELIEEEVLKRVQKTLA